KTGVYMLNIPSFVWRSELHFPANYEIEYRRPDKKIESEFFNYTYSASLDSNNVWTAYVELTVKSRFIPLERYAEYRRLVQDMDANNNESMVLRRIKQ